MEAFFLLISSFCFVLFVWFRQVRSIFFFHQMSWCSGFSLAIIDARVQFTSYFVTLMCLSVIVYQGLWMTICSKRNAINEEAAYINSWSGLFRTGQKWLLSGAFLILLLLAVRLMTIGPALNFDNRGRALELAFGANELVNAMLFTMIPFSFFMSVGVLLGISSKVHVLGMILTLLFLYFLGVKGNVYFASLLIFFVFFYSGRVSVLALPIFVSIGAALFIFMMGSRYGLHLNAENVKDVFQVLTGYVAFNFSNLQDYTFSKDRFGYGAGLLLAVPCLVTSGSHWCADDILGVDRSKPYELYASPNFNIETGYGKLYVEFGDTVFIVLPTLFFIVHLLAHKFRFRSIGWLGIYCIVSAASVLNFFDLRLLHPVTIFSLLVVIVFAGVFLRRKVNY